MKNIRLTVEYEGTNYHGFQKQPGLVTIQEVLEVTMNKNGIKNKGLIFASRTDAGVHATGQVINFLSNCRVPTIKIPVILNRLLPSDIRIKEAKEMPMSFHARRQAKSRSYIYNLYCGQDLPVFLKKYVHQTGYRLNLRAMKKAMNYFTGKHDFTSFSCGGRQDEGNFIRNIYELKLFKADLGTAFDGANKQIIKIFVRANGFLRRMVRAMVGTLIDVGRGKIKPEAIKEIILAQDRSLAAPFAPAHGLCLVKVEY